MDFIDCDVLVIGAGAIGLAATAELATQGRSVILVEKESRVSSITSSRNSEVIHSGIYYKRDSLKARLCIRGNHLLYQYLKERSLPHRKCGKIIFCNSQSQEENLEVLYQNAQNRKIKARYSDRIALSKINEVAKAKLAIEVDDTGIFDSYSYFQCLVSDIEQNSGLISLNTKVLEIDMVHNNMQTLCEQNYEKFTVRSQYVLNTTGSGALKLIRHNFPQKYSEYEDFYVKGHYFSFQKNKKLDTLYYPMPTSLGLGVHLTIDLMGNIRFGPDTLPVSSAHDYTQEVADETFYDSVAQNFPFVKKSDLLFSYAGIRPKLKVNGLICDDFFFSKDYEGRMVSALGIESPGLTSSIAIAEYFTEILEC